MLHDRKRILVAGGAGFLGSHLCDRLLEQGYDVLCVDNFYTGTKRNIVHLLDNPYFELFRHDITFPLYVEVDEIYNLACPVKLRSTVHEVNLFNWGLSCFPHPLPERPGANYQGERPWVHQHARACQEA